MASTLDAIRRGALTFARVAVGGVLAGALAIALAAPVAAQPCRAQWEGGFVREAPTDDVRILRAFTDGSTGRSALAAFGDFETIGSRPFARAALWDGESWSTMGQGLTGAVRQALEFDDGSGPALYVAGDFTIVGTNIRGIARWRNGAWDAAGSPTIGGFSVIVGAGLAVFDEGEGPRLHAIASAFSQKLIVWNGQGWTALGEPISGHVRSIESVSSGPLRGLYLGGAGLRIGLLPFPGQPFLRWDGAAWGLMPDPRPPMTAVNSIASFDGPGETAGLYFLSVGSGSSTPTHLYRWDGQDWTEAPPELPRAPMRVVSRAGVETMHFIDSQVGLVTWDGSGVAPLGPPQASATTFEYFDAEGADPERVYLGGEFKAPSSAASWDAPSRIAREADNRWERLDNGLPAPIELLAVLDAGQGHAMHAVMRIGEDRVVLRFDGRRWRTVSVIPGVEDRVRRLVRFDRGLAPGVVGLYAAMESYSFNHSASSPYWGIARWTAAAWETVGGGLAHWYSQSGARGPRAALGLAVFDDGQGGGEQLYASGSFNRAGDVPVSNIARWDGVAWSPVGGGLPGSVLDILPFDDGAGPRLYAVGTFRAPGSFFGPGIARWDGQSWEYLPTPPVSIYGQVLGLAEQRVAGQGRLVVVGSHGAARWADGSWEALDGPADLQLTGPCDSLLAWGDGPTQRLLAWGRYGIVAVGSYHGGGYPYGALRSFAVWEHGRWSVPAQDIEAGRVWSFVAFDAGDGAAIWAGGEFSQVGVVPGTPGGVPTSHVATIRDLTTTCAGDANLDGVVDMMDLAAVLSDFGTLQPPSYFVPILPGDVDLDGKCDFYDLALLLASFGTTCE